ncbi:hypothetical protein VTJ83DRAFT_3351 [Remersonia thermophila]|uniref:DNA/RNA-binding domain-containing protein n=1 Tax=Remersonia thermophila TaxID=72144 RepID=A0ABR4DDS3_9PEZI
MELDKKWYEHLRQASKRQFRCPECNRPIFNFRLNEGHSPDTVPVEFENHFARYHNDLLPAKGLRLAGTDVVLAKWQQALQASVYNSSRQDFTTHCVPINKDEQKPAGPPSPTGSVKRESPPVEASSKRPRTGPSEGDDVRAEFDRRGLGQKKGQLWDPNHNTQPSDIKLIKEPDTRPISHDQLVAEVKGIYAGLVMVESKCIEVVNAQTSSMGDGAAKLNKDQWHALIALHRTLLHEHHDFFLASQHPSASLALRRLAAKYAMPARMWRHGIHSFLELLRHNLPGSLDHMLTFIYMAYSMMALLLETVPAFEDTWIECLGDLGRYRMAIEDEDIRDREHWASVARSWYSRASDGSPTTGRLYHHLGILARPNSVQQLFYYTKSLCVEIPFLSARESIMTLFEPIMSRTPNPQQSKLSPTILNFVKAHGILFSGKQTEELDGVLETFFRSLDNHIARSSRRWLEAAYQTSLANICAVCGYGDETNPIAASLLAFARSPARPSGTETQRQDHTPPPNSETSAEDTKTSRMATGTAAGGCDQPSCAPTTSAAAASEYTKGVKRMLSSRHPQALRLFVSTYDIVCRRFADNNTLPFLHTTLVFVHHLTFCPDGMAYFAPHFPWKLTAAALNTLLNGSSASTSALPSVSQATTLTKLVQSEEFPWYGWDEGKDVETEKKGPAASSRQRKPLPDDWAMRGFPWGETYFPKRWFDVGERIDDDDKYFEQPSMLDERKERVIWLGGRIAARQCGLRFDPETSRFGVTPEYEVDLEVDVSRGGVGHRV